MVLGLHTRSLTLLKGGPQRSRKQSKRMIDESLKWLITKQPKDEDTHRGEYSVDLPESEISLRRGGNGQRCKAKQGASSVTRGRIRS